MAPIDAAPSTTAATQPSLGERAVAATAGGALSSLLVTPLDVIKVRQQATFGTGAASARGGLGTIGCAAAIIRQEGPRALWNGLSPTMALTVPSTVIYLASYDLLRETASSSFSSPSVTNWAPLVAGGCARALSAAATAPVELLRTRAQAVVHESLAVQGGLLASALALARRDGVRTLWRGATAQLARDVPFSCLYWGTYEKLRPAFHERGALGSSIGAAAVAGALSGAATTPLDVVKTRVQVLDGAATAAATGGSALGGSCARVLCNLVRREGVCALFTGVVPRVSKSAPSCAIIVGAYELGKQECARRKKPRV
mmetsp:Transcript_51806/g.119077  ORF Transcript_51806/g.119077 Transcript_51806/m.119077 type:complete len:315 (-) Transcript_51806:200-1144(-)|eukprot:CAMPEP_0119378460 /NCGR_PEP_ID=MMETSP1334-20130426/48400_1 /TAXON_ID=127549 /ORGANISM="Calcidiscus leptoporus, Strain RCC1130" /LENGTH=314 /DNA_ID=CAMNT_0007397667 /DNA_START=23 /DNA_END=967 /DNA_ORIENTATION=+